MKTSGELRKHLQINLADTVATLNSYLRGHDAENLKPILERVGRGGKLPHWFELLVNGQSMPNLDGKTIGSVIEMTFLAVLEKHTFKDFNLPPLTVNPAKGIDFPFLELGMKSPSENFCTSEPFFSAYERILGSEFDSIVLLTDYQTAKKSPPPVRIQIIKHSYLKGSEIADKNLCAIAQKNKEQLFNESEALCKKMLQFLCYVNQQDWRAKALLKLLDVMYEGDDAINDLLSKLEAHFIKKEDADNKKGDEPLSRHELDIILSIKDSVPKHAAIVNACSDWVIDSHKDFARLPNDNEWQRFLKSPLDGRIGMSFALQWRFNFGNLFSDIEGDELIVTENPNGLSLTPHNLEFETQMEVARKIMKDNRAVLRELAK
jgi:hypothetical protein